MKLSFVVVVELSGIKVLFTFTWRKEGTRHLLILTDGQSPNSPTICPGIPGFDEDCKLVFYRNLPVLLIGKVVHVRAKRHSCITGRKLGTIAVSTKELSYPRITFRKPETDQIDTSSQGVG